MHAARFPFPLGPLLERRTVRYEVERGVLWMFEQEQSLANSTATNVRMVAIRLAGGGLWIHAPIAPTRCRVPPESLHVIYGHLAGHMSTPHLQSNRAALTIISFQDTKWYVVCRLVTQ